MTPTLFYGVEYGSSFGSIVALEQLGEPYRLCRIEMPEVSQSATYKSINPVGEVPSLITQNGTVLTESVATLNHIAARGIDKGLGYRQGTAAFDRYNQVLAFLNSRYFSAYNPLWYSVEFSDDDDKKALRGEGKALVEMAHVKLEALLGDREWLMGDRMTAAEAYFAGVARWNDVHKIIEWSDFPRIKALFDKVQHHPAVKFAHAIEDGKEPKGSGAFRGHVTLEEIAERLQRDRARSPLADAPA